MSQSTDINPNVVLTADTGQYSQQMLTAQQDTDRLTQSVDRLLGTLDRMSKTAGRGLQIISAGTVATLTAAGTAAGHFDEQMSSLHANAVIADRSLDATNRRVNNLRRDLPLTTETVIELVSALEKAGVQPQDMEKQVQTYTKLASVTGESVGSLATGMVNLQRQMGTLPVSTERYANVLAGLSGNMNVSAQAVLDYSNALAPVARTVNMTQQEIMGFSAAFARQGVDGDRAATTMQRMIADISRSARYGTTDLEAYASLVGTTVDNFKEMSASQQIVEVFESISRAGPDAIKILDRMGIDGAQAAHAIRSVSQGGGLQAALREAGIAFDGDALDRGAAESMDSVNKSAQQLRNSLSVLASEVGGPLTGALSGMIDLLTKATNAASALLGPISGVVSAAGMIAAPIAGIAGTGLVNMGGLMGLAGGAALLRSPLAAGIMSGRRPNDPGGGARSGYMRRSIDNLREGRGGPLQNRMFAAGAAIGSLMTRDGRASVAQGLIGRLPREAQEVARQYVQRFRGATAPVVAAWQNVGGRFQPQEGATFRQAAAGLGPRAAMMGSLLVSGAARMGASSLRPLFPGALMGDMTQRRERAGQPGLFRAAVTGRMPDRSLVTFGAALNNATRGLTGLVAASARATAGLTGLALQGVGRGLLAGGGALMGALGGPAGLAIMGGIGLIGYLSHSRQKTDDYHDALIAERGNETSGYNRYAGELGLEGRAANVLPPGTAGAASGQPSDPRRATPEMERAVNQPGFSFTDEFIAGLDRESDEDITRATAYVSSIYSYPNADEEVLRRTTADLTRRFGRATAQRIIDEASTGQVNIMDLYSGSNTWRFNTWDATDEQRESFNQARHTAADIQATVADLYGADSRELRQTQVAHVNQMLESLRDINSYASVYGHRGERDLHIDQLEMMITGRRGGLNIGQFDRDRLMAAGSLEEQVELLKSILEETEEGRSWLESMGEDIDWLTTESPAIHYFADGTERDAMLGTSVFSGSPDRIGLLQTDLGQTLYRGSQGELLTDALTQEGNRILGDQAARAAAEQTLSHVGRGSYGAHSLGILALEEQMGLIGNPNDPAYQQAQAAQVQLMRQRGVHLNRMDPISRMQENYSHLMRVLQMDPATEGYAELLAAAEEAVWADGDQLKQYVESYYRAREDLEYQQEIATVQYERSRRWQEEDYLRQRAYAAEDFERGVARTEEGYQISRGRSVFDYELSMARTEEDYQLSVQRAEEDFQRQRMWALFDFDLARQRSEEDYQRSRLRQEEDYFRQREFAVYDYNLSRLRAEEDFNHQQVLMARQTSRQMQDIYTRMTIRPTWDASNLLVNAEDQLRRMEEQQENLAALRGMGLSGDVISQLGLNEMANVDQLARLVSDLAENPELVERFNENIAQRLAMGARYATDEDNEQWREMQRQYELSRQRQEEDFQRSIERQDEMFELQRQRQEEDYRRSLDRSDEDFERSLRRSEENYRRSMDRQEEDYRKMIDRSAEDFSRAMNRMDEDHARMMRHTREDYEITMDRNAEQYEIMVTRNAIVWEEQMANARESLERSFRITTKTFGELAEFAMGEMTDTTAQQMAALAKGMAEQEVEIERATRSIASSLPKWMADMFGGEDNAARALAGTPYGRLIQQSRSGGGRNPGQGGKHLNSIGGGADSLTPGPASVQAETETYEKILESGPIMGGGSGAGSGTNVHPLAGQSFRYTSPYGRRRDPITGQWQHHWGTDMAAPTGTPIKSFASGRVTHAGWLGQGGNVVIIQHANGMATRYHHMSRIGVREGQHVGAGSVIGAIGSTGYSTGPHLHFMVLHNGRDVNPEPYLRGEKSIVGLGGGRTSTDSHRASDVDRYLLALRQHESGNNYRARSPISSASGAYQYIDSTWNGYGGYSRAYLAPPHIQDERARQDALRAYARYGNWEQVAAHHFYPAWANRRNMWDRRPSPGNPTVNAYVASVMSKMGMATSGGITFIGATPDGDWIPVPSRAEMLQTIVQAKETQEMERRIGEGPMAGALPRGRFSLGLGLTWANAYDPGYADTSLNETDWFARGAIVSGGGRKAIIGEHGPEMVLPLDGRGADFMADLLSRYSINGAEKVRTSGSVPVTSNTSTYYQRIDQGNHFHGPISVQAQDPYALVAALEKQARMKKLVNSR